MERINLTGEWVGVYIYQSGRKVSFSACIQQTNDHPRFVGQTSDSVMRSLRNWDGLIRGVANGNEVSFKKEYLSLHNDPIEYQGTLIGRNAMKGTWILYSKLGQYSGTFEMCRVNFTIGESASGWSVSEKQVKEEITRILLAEETE